MFDKQRIYGLDILRALAILFVVILHGEYLLPDKLSRLTDLVVFDGVSIFFVLSGFLVGNILIKTMAQNTPAVASLWQFWRRRWYRTLPNYFFVLTLLTILHLLFDKNFMGWSVLKYAVFAQNLFTPHPLHFFPEAWSLSIEEWFYILVPLLAISFIYFGKLQPRMALLITVIMVIITITFFRYYRYVHSPALNAEEWDLVFRKQVSTRLDSLVFGVLGAYCSFYYPGKWIRYKKQLFVAGIVFFLLIKFILPHVTEISGLYQAVFSFTLVAVATLMLLPLLSSLQSGSGPLYKIISYISLISYSMYLLNLSVIQDWIIHKINWHTFIQNVYLLVIVKYTFYWLLVICLSALLYHFFERPVTMLREKNKR